MAIEHTFELLFEDFAERLGIATKHPATVVVLLERQTEFLDGSRVGYGDESISFAGGLGFSFGGLSRFCLGRLVLFGLGFGLSGCRSCSFGFPSSGTGCDFFISCLISGLNLLDKTIGSRF